MLYGDPYKFLSEAASADLLDPQVSEEVKDVVEELEDELTTNVEEVPAEDKEDNHAVLSAEELKETATLYRLSEGKVGFDIRDLLRICEAEEEAAAEAGETAEVDAGEVAADVAEKNDVEVDDLVIVAPADVAAEIIESAILEAKCGRKGKAAKKANGLLDAVKNLKKKGIKVATVKKKK